MKESNIYINYVETLFAIISEAKDNYDIWWLYKEENNREKYNKVLEAYNFFPLSLRAHFLAIVINLYMLYEKQKNTVNFDSFIKFLKTKDSNLDETFQNDILEIKNSIWKKIAILRNNLFAHTSNKPEKDFFKDADICADDLLKLIEDSLSLLNKIDYHYRYNTYFSLSTSELNAKFSAEQVLIKLKETI